MSRYSTEFNRPILVGISTIASNAGRLLIDLNIFFLSKKAIAK
jgi:hypothetical protein